MSEPGFVPEAVGKCGSSLAADLAVEQNSSSRTVEALSPVLYSNTFPAVPPTDALTNDWS